MFRFICSVIIILVFPSSVFAGGLSSNWGEVVIENIEPGKLYDLNTFLSTSFKITNNFEEKITLKLQVLIPGEKELKTGYQAIEDVSWVKVKENVTINTKETAVVPIQIHIPDDIKYLGKKYQLWVWSHTSGQTIGVGLKSRIMFSVINKK